MIYLKYLWQVLRHKWFVFLEACNLGIPWLGLIHDLSKFLPGEFIPYARYFYGTYDDQQKRKINREFDLAWNKHQKRNKHHWQWWVLIYDHPEKEPEVLIPISTLYKLEMLADWKGAGRAYGNPDLLGWYKEHRPHMRMDKYSQYSMDMAVGYRVE